MKFLLLGSFLAILASCGGGGGGGGSGQTAPEFKVVFVYPENDMTPGQGERVVQPIGVVCHDDKGEVVDDSNCPDINSIVVENGPTDVQKSPAGLFTITVPNSEEGIISVEVGEGFTLDTLPDEEKKNFFQDKITCVSTHFLDFKGECNDEPFALRYSEWDRSSILACDGSGTAMRTSVCVDSKTGDPADDQGSCTETPILSETQPSPMGQATKMNTNGDTLVVVCAEGKTVEDIGSGSSVVEVVSCGSGRYDSGLSCSLVTYSPTEFIFPENDLTAGEGERVVNATGVSICTEDHTGNSVDISLCGVVDFSEVTQTQQSPAGTITVVQPNGDSITYTVGIGQTPSSDGVVGVATSCAEDRHIVDNACVDDVFIPSDFNFTPNNLAIGAGQRSVTALSFSTCTRQHTGESVATSKCSMPNPRPSQIQLSPAGQMTKNVTFANSNPVVTLDVEEGQTVTTADLNNLAIPELAIIGCQTGYKIASNGYACQSKTFPMITYNAINKVHLPTGHVNIVPTITNPDGLTLNCERTDETPASITVNANCTITGNYYTKGTLSIPLTFNFPDSSSPDFKEDVSVDIVADDLWVKISPATSNNCSNYDPSNSSALIEKNIMYCTTSTGGFWKPVTTGDDTTWTYVNGAKILAGYGLSQITTNFPKTLNSSAMSFTVTDARGIKPTITKNWTLSHGAPLNGVQADVQMNILGVDSTGGVYVHLYYYWYTGIYGAEWENEFLYFPNGSNTPKEVYFTKSVFNKHGLDRKNAYWAGEERFLILPKEGLRIDTSYLVGSYNGALDKVEMETHGAGLGDMYASKNEYAESIQLVLGDSQGSSLYNAPAGFKVRYPIQYSNDNFLVANGNIGNLDFFYVAKKPAWGNFTFASHEYLPGPIGIQSLSAVLALGHASVDDDGDTKHEPVYAFVINGKIEFWRFNTYIAELE